MLPKPPIIIVIADNAKNDLQKIDKNNRNNIIAGLERYSETGTPRPKALVGNLKGFWRLRFGDYRVIVEYSEQTAIVLCVDHRKKVYKGL